MAYSMHYNGVDLSGSSYGLTVLQGPVSFVPASRTTLRALGTRHGGYSQGGYLEPRELPVSGYVTGTSASNMKSKLDALKLVMNPANGEKSIRLDHVSDRYWLGRLAGDIEYTNVGPSSCKVEMRFQCADPLAYSTTETTQTVTVDTNPEVATVPAAGVVAGTEYARPVWKVQNTTGGSVSLITIMNSTTGEVCTCTYTVPNNDWVRFDSQRERLQYSPDDVEWFDIMAYLGTDQKLFPRLAPGVANSVSVLGLTSGVLTVVYRARYL